MEEVGMQSRGEEKDSQDMEIKQERKVTSLTLYFPKGESSSICDRIAAYADKIATYGCSGGGLAITRMPLTKEDDEHFGTEFDETRMEYSYEYEKKPFKS